MVLSFYKKNPVTISGTSDIFKKSKGKIYNCTCSGNGNVDRCT